MQTDGGVIQRKTHSWAIEPWQAPDEKTYSFRSGSEATINSHFQTDNYYNKKVNYNFVSPHKNLIYTMFPLL